MHYLEQKLVGLVFHIVFFFFSCLRYHSTELSLLYTSIVIVVPQSTEPDLKSRALRLKIARNKRCVFDTCSIL